MADTLQNMKNTYNSRFPPDKKIKLIHALLQRDLPAATKHTRGNVRWGSLIAHKDKKCATDNNDPQCLAARARIMESIRGIHRKQLHGKRGVIRNYTDTEHHVGFCDDEIDEDAPNALFSRDDTLRDAWDTNHELALQGAKLKAINLSAIESGTDMANATNLSFDADYVQNSYANFVDAAKEGDVTSIKTHNASDESIMKIPKTFAWKQRESKATMQMPNRRESSRRA